MPIRIAKSDAGGSPCELGMQAFKEKRWLEAISFLGSALDHDPQDTEMIRCIALAHNALGDAKTARSLLGKAIAARPDFAEAHRDMAVLLANDGRPMEAAEHASRAVELDPWNDESLTILNRIRAQAGAIKPASKKAKGKRPTRKLAQSKVDACRGRMNSALRTAIRVRKTTSGGAAGERPTISLCMIARNEEEFIGDCLSSAKGLADEIILMDTGSTDHTREIAKSRGATVHHMKWPDSYAEARNAALDHAKSDWILILDADERLDKTSKSLILRAIRNPNFDGYALYFRNYIVTGTNPDYFVHRTCRLFRNKPEYRFVGRIHERIVGSIESAGGKVGEIDALIHHHGYRPDIVENRKKHEKYIQLLLADLRESPTDAFCLYNLGAAYSTHADYEDARLYLQMAADSVTPEHEFAAAAFTRLARACCEIGKAEEAVEVLDRAERKQIQHPEIHFSKGNALLDLKRYNEAVAAFQSAIALGQKESWLGDPGAYGHKAYYGIGKAYMALGACELAINSCRRALSLNPNDFEAHELIGAAYLNLARPHDAEWHLSESARLNPSSLQAGIRLAEAFEQQKRYPEAQAKYAEVLAAGHETPELRFKLGLCMHRAGDRENAEGHYQRAIELRTEYPQAHTALGLLYAEQGRLAEAMGSFAAAVSADPAYSEAYFNAADLLYAAENYPEAADVYQSGLVYDPANARGFLSLGNCYSRMGAPDAAAIAYRQALALKLDYPEARRNLAQVEQATGFRKAA